MQTTINICLLAWMRRRDIPCSLMLFVTSGVIKYQIRLPGDPSQVVYNALNPLEAEGDRLRFPLVMGPLR